MRIVFRFALLCVHTGSRSRSSKHISYIRAICTTTRGRLQCKLLTGLSAQEDRSVLSCGQLRGLGSCTGWERLPCHIEYLFAHPTPTCSRTPGTGVELSRLCAYVISLFSAAIPLSAGHLSLSISERSIHREQQGLLSPLSVTFDAHGISYAIFVLV